MIVTWTKNTRKRRSIIKRLSTLSQLTQKVNQKKKRNLTEKNKPSLLKKLPSRKNWPESKNLPGRNKKGRTEIALSLRGKKLSPSTRSQGRSLRVTLRVARMKRNSNPELTQRSSKMTVFSEFSQPGTIQEKGLAQLNQQAISCTDLKLILSLTILLPLKETTIRQSIMSELVL